MTILHQSDHAGGLPLVGRVARAISAGAKRIAAGLKLDADPGLAELDDRMLRDIGLSRHGPRAPGAVRFNDEPAWSGAARVRRGRRNALEI